MMYGSLVGPIEKSVPVDYIDEGTLFIIRVLMHSTVWCVWNRLTER